MLPQLDVRQLSCLRQSALSCRFTRPDVQMVSSGRIAIYYALQDIGIGKGDSVLVPAYHCGSMIEPVIWLNAIPRFFKLNSELNADLKDLLQKTDGQCKAMIMPHFFGFQQDMTILKSFCQQHHIKLIEDCAHSFFGQKGNVTAGTSGDYSITSNVKFFPGTEGGILAANHHPLPAQPLQQTGLTIQLKALFNLFETAAVYHKAGWAGKLFTAITGRKTAVVNQQVLEQYPASTQHKRKISRDKLDWFDPARITLQPSLADRFIVRHSNCRHIIDKRRQHFNYLLTQLSQLQYARPLYTSLPEGTVPYVFPLLLNSPEQHFARLKTAGVPIWRWEELVETDCDVSQDYRLKLIQLPCHQSLNQQDLDWIIQVLTTTLNQW